MTLPFRPVLFAGFLAFGLLSCSENADKSKETSAAKDSSAKQTTAVDYYKSLTPVRELEMYCLSWPGDDLLCDSYEGSEGVLDFCVYRLKSSKKIVYVDVAGAYCQGDSEFGWICQYDEQGTPLYYYTGRNEYVPTVNRYLTSDKSVIQVTEEPDMGRGIGRSRKVETLKTMDAPGTADIEKQIADLHGQMRQRLAALKKMEFNADETDKKREAQMLMDSLQASLSRGIKYSGGFVLRKPMPTQKGTRGEWAQLTGTDIRVRAKPGSKEEIVAKINCYDLPIEVIDMADAEMIAPFGKHPWYKITYEDFNTRKPIQGWIFGAFVMEDAYPR